MRAKTQVLQKGWLGGGIRVGEEREMESQGSAALIRAGERRHSIGEPRGILRSLPEGRISYDAPGEKRVLVIFAHNSL